MIRITSTVQGSEMVIAIAGRLEERHLAELETHCPADSRTVVFELSGLQSTDEAGICWLRQRLAKRDRVTSASPYVGFRLEHAPTNATTQ